MHILTFLLLTIPLCSSPLFSQKKIPVIHGKIQRLEPFGGPDTLYESYFFRLASIACTEEGKLFVADGLAMCVRVFSLGDGKELYRIGKRGSGPGEFQSLERIRLYRDGKFSVIDNVLRRCTLFSLNGKLLETVTLKEGAADVEFLDDRTIIAVNFLFDFDHRPIKVMRASLLAGYYVQEEFGQIIDPRKGLTEFISKFVPGSRGVYSYALARITVLPDKENVVYSQSNPYSLVRYNLATKKSSAFTAPIDIDTDDQLQVKLREGGGAKFRREPSGEAMSPHIYESSLVVAIFRADAQKNYLDRYDANTCVFLARYAIPALPKKVFPVATALRGNRELLLLVRDEAGINWVERFSLKLLQH